MVGNDWGARAAYIASYLLADKARHCISLSVGYGTTNPNQEMSLKQIKNYWYHWYMATEHDKELVEKKSQKILSLYVEAWSPKWQFTDEEFNETASSFGSNDWAVLLNKYIF